MSASPLLPGSPSPAPTETVVQTAQTIAQKSPTTTVILIIVLAISFILNGIFGYSYKEVTKESETKDQTIQNLKSQLSAQTNETITKKPVLLGGQIAYETVEELSKKLTKTTSDKSSDTSDIKSKDQTIIRKNTSELGVGYGLNGDKEILVGAQVLSVIGIPINVKIVPDIDHFNNSAAFITINPPSF